MPHQKPRSREARIALVLYGGVSLAIYENGVARTFFDFVRGQGPFGLLSDLLDANVTVDVIAGTSAGGINGLMLAAALESGADFSAASRLWRRQGDLGRLLRKPTGALEFDSLLDGEGYYQEQLTRAFEKLCTREDVGYQSPGEIDVFITGTDLDGEIRVFEDSLGARIEDKEHRTVFRLKHRPDRKALGCWVSKRQADVAKQASILASISRITSTFPSAFPPFELDQLERHRSEVAEALRDFGYPRSKRQRRFIDGGLLDNKPFGPALDAIFHRMPSCPVDRRLFFVEPSPEKFDKRRPQDVSPLGVVLSSVVSIPAHESIGGDLDRLINYNARVRWIKELKKALQQKPALTPGLPAEKVRCPSDPAPHYDMIRRHALAISLVLESDNTPTAGDYVVGEERQRLYGHLMGALRRRLGDDAVNIECFDVAFQIRRAFHFLYEFYEALHERHERNAEAAEGSEVDWTPVLAVGRVVKALKIVRVMLLRLRRRLVDEVSGSILETPEYAERVLTVFSDFLAADAAHWQALYQEVPFPPSDRQPDESESADSKQHPHRPDDCFRDLRRRLRDTNEPLRSALRDLFELLPSDEAAREPTLKLLPPRVLTDVVLAAGEAIRQITPVQTPGADAADSDSDGRSREPLTVLDYLALVLDAIVDLAPPLNANRNGTIREDADGDSDDLFADYSRLDGHLYPQVFTGGVYELDEVRFARISPFDATEGLAGRVTGEDKLTGDMLAHFAAFLRQDWRSNDILWGRLDGIAEVVASFLDKPAFDRIGRRQRQLDHHFDPTALQTAFPHAPTACLEELNQAWLNFRRSWRPTAENAGFTPPLAPCERYFREKYIVATQMDAFLQDVASVYEDLHFQEIKWGLERGDRQTTSESDDHAIRKDAAAMAREDLQPMSAADTWRDFTAMGLGSQTVTGADGAIPHNVLGEYSAQAYLLFWGMLRRSLGGLGRGLLDRTRFFTRTLPAFVFTTLVLLRRQATTAVVYVTTIEVMLLTLTVRAVWKHEWSALPPPLIGAFLFAWIVRKGTPRVGKPRMGKTLLQATLVAGLAFGVAAAVTRLWCNRVCPLVEGWLRAVF